MIKLDPMKANTQGQELKVNALGTSVILKDILIGEVWLASGQSNMGFTIPNSTHAEEARKLIPHPTLRRFKVGPYIADEPLADIGADGAFQHPRWRMGDDGQWRTVDPASVRSQDERRFASSLVGGRGDLLKRKAFAALDALGVGS